MCLGTGMASAWRGANKEVMKPMHGENSEDVDGVTNATRSSALLRWDGDWSHSDFCRTLGIIPELFSSLLHFFLHMQMAYIHLSSLQLTLYNCYRRGERASTTSIFMLFFVYVASHADTLPWQGLG